MMASMMALALAHLLWIARSLCGYKRGLDRTTADQGKDKLPRYVVLGCWP